MSLSQTILVTAPRLLMIFFVVLAPNFLNSLQPFHAKTLVNHLCDLFILTRSPLPFLRPSWIHQPLSFYKPRKDRLPSRQPLLLDFTAPKQNSNYPHQFCFYLTIPQDFLSLIPDAFQDFQPLIPESYQDSQALIPE